MKEPPAWGPTFPDALLVTGALGGHHNPLNHKVGRVEPDTKLPNHGHVSAGGEHLHEPIRPRDQDLTMVG
jgi:hypothetical protein